MYCVFFPVGWHRCNLEGGGGGGKAPQIFFLPKNSFFGY